MTIKRDLPTLTEPVHYNIIRTEACKGDPKKDKIFFVRNGQTTWRFRRECLRVLRSSVILKEDK
jgi:hypothetical protein